MARVPLQERPRSADHDLQGISLRDAQRLRQARAWRCPTPARSRDTKIATASSGAGGAGGLRRGDRSAPCAKRAHASNWELVSAKHSASGHPIAVMGPQVGYYVPQILMEEDLHGPGIDARGAAFAGVNLLRRARPWPRLRLERDQRRRSDNVDTFAEVLCRDKFHYLYRGKCKPMEKLEKTESWTPNAIDSTEAGSQTLTAYRTVHGIVFARGKVDGKKVAFAHQRSTYFHEARLGDRLRPAERTRVRHRRLRLQEGDLQHQLPLQLGLRRLRTHRLRALRGRCRSAHAEPRPTSRSSVPGKYDWKGFKPATQTAEYLPFSKHPQAVDPRLPRLLEQQAGAGLGRGRRPVRLRRRCSARR